jgi:uncharacterized small protein (TIGR04563 family)
MRGDISSLAMGQKLRPTDKRKHSLYFSADLLKEIGDEATRQDRSLSWIVQKAWRLARREIMGAASAGQATIRSKLEDPTR